MPFRDNFSIPEAFGLDAELLENLATAYQSYGLLRTPEPLPLSPSWHPSLKRSESHQGGEWCWPANLRAGYMARAASYWATIDPGRARKCYGRANAFTSEIESIENDVPTHQGVSRQTQSDSKGHAAHKEEVELRHARATIGAAPFALLAGQHALEVAWRLEQSLAVFRIHPTPEVLRVVLSTGSSVTLQTNEPFIARWLETFHRHTERFAAQPVGRLQLPLQYYIRLAHLSLAHLSERSDRSAIAEWVHDLDQRVTERVRLAQSSGYHWRHLYSSLLPLEAELLVPFHALVHLRDRSDVEQIVDQMSPILMGYFVAAARLQQNEDRRAA